MKFEPAEDTEAIFYRRVSSSVEMGVWRVIYGYRIRAGWLGEPVFRLDWCCGADWSFVQTMYSIASAILTSREDGMACFDGLPTVSRVKPAYNDPEFMLTILNLVPKGKLVQFHFPEPRMAYQSMGE